MALTQFNEVEVGAYFTWKGKTYRKLHNGRALNMGDDSILDVGLHLKVEVIDRPRRRIDLVIQYLDWALIQAHKEEHPDVKEVVIRLDLVRCQSITSYDPKK